MAENTDNVLMYHYTSKENAEKIVKDGVINPSPDGAYGGGKVYMTKLPPDEGKAAIARNNYDGMKGAYWEQRESQGSVDYVIPLNVPRSQVTKENDPLGRDIHTIQGPVKLP